MVEQSLLQAARLQHPTAWVEAPYTRAAGGQVAVGGAEFNTWVVCADHHGSSEHRVPGHAC